MIYALCTLLLVVHAFELDKGSILGYYSLEEVQDLLASFVENREDARLETIGLSVEGRDIPALVLPNPGKPKVLIVGDHHARELISVTQVLFLADLLLTTPSSRLETLRESLEYWFVPVLNVDTYQLIGETYYHLNWIPDLRKNRRSNNCKDRTKGVDLNRNYPFKWGVDDQGSSNNECSQDYRGPSALSEPETRAIASLLQREHFTTAISYHSYGDLYVHPYSYLLEYDSSLLRPGDYDSYLRLKTALCEKCVMGSAVELVDYPVNGNFIDYAYSLGVFSVAVELGPTFHPDANQIEDILETHLDPALFLLEMTSANISVTYARIVEEDTLLFSIRVYNTGLTPGPVSVSLEMNKNFTVKSATSSSLLEFTVSETTITIEYEAPVYSEEELALQITPANVKITVTPDRQYTPVSVSVPYSDFPWPLFLAGIILCGITLLMPVIYFIRRKIINTSKHIPLEELEE